jgi:hypothetical protein
MTLPLTFAGPSAGGSLQALSAAPATAVQAETFDLVVTGKNFKITASATDLGTGVTINSTTWDSKTQLTINATVVYDAPIGAHDLVITQGTKTVTLAAALTVGPGNPLLLIPDQVFCLDASNGPLVGGSRTPTLSDKASWVGTNRVTTRTSGVDFWLEAWVIPTSVAVTQYIWNDGGDTNANRGVSLKLNNTTLRLQISDGTTTANFDSSAVMAAGSLQHIVVTCDRDGLARFYVNAVAKGTADISAYAALNISTGAALWPTVASNQNASGWFGGTITCVRYGEAYIPSAAEVTTLYNAGNPLTHGDIVADLPALAAKLVRSYNGNETAVTDPLRCSVNTANNLVKAGGWGAVTNVNDPIGGYDGTLTNHVDNARSLDVSDNCLSDQSIVLDGANDYIAADSLVAAVAANTAGTMCAWVKKSVFAANANILSFGDTNANSYLQLYVQITTGKLGALAISGGTVKWSIITNAAAVLAGVWVHVALTHDGSVPHLLVDGVEVAHTHTDSTDLTVWVSQIAGLDNFSIGGLRYNNTFGGYSTGYHSDARYYSSALSIADLLKLATNQEASVAPVAKWIGWDTAAGIGVGNAPAALGSPTKDDPIVTWNDTIGPYALTQTLFPSRPSFAGVSLGTKVGVTFDGLDDEMPVAVPAWALAMDLRTLYGLLKPAVAQVTDRVLWSNAKASVTDIYWEVYIPANTLKIGIRYNAGAGAVTLVSDLSLRATGSSVFLIRSDTAWTVYIDKVLCVMTGTNTGQYLAAIAGETNATLGARVNTTILLPYTGDVLELVGSSTQVTAKQITDSHNWLVAASILA